MRGLDRVGQYLSRTRMLKRVPKRRARTVLVRVMTLKGMLKSGVGTTTSSGAVWHQRWGYGGQGAGVGGARTRGEGGGGVDWDAPPLPLSTRPPPAPF